jgi:hypothetical protein
MTTGPERLLEFHYLVAADNKSPLDRKDRRLLCCGIIPRPILSYTDPIPAESTAFSREITWKRDQRSSSLSSE